MAAGITGLRRGSLCTCRNPGAQETWGAECAVISSRPHSTSAGLPPPHRPGRGLCLTDPPRAVPGAAAPAASPGHWLERRLPGAAQTCRITTLWAGLTPQVGLPLAPGGSLCYDFGNRSLEEERTLLYRASLKLKREKMQKCDYFVFVSIWDGLSCENVDCTDGLGWSFCREQPPRGQMGSLVDLGAACATPGNDRASLDFCIPAGHISGQASSWPGLGFSKSAALSSFIHSRIHQKLHIKRIS